MKTAVVVPQEYQATVVAKKRLSPKVIFVQLQAISPISFREGQYASFLIGNDRRPFSFASLASEPLLDFVIDITPGGVGSTFFTNMQPGDQVRFLAPYGRFVLAESARPRLFIATGAGIAPIRGHIKKILADPTERQPITLVFGNHDERHTLFFKEFEELASAHNRFTFIPVCSAPADGWAGEQGLVTEVTPRHVPAIAQHEVYVCGSQQMVRDTAAMLRRHQVPPEQIHTEQFI